MTETNGGLATLEDESQAAIDGIQSFLSKVRVKSNQLTVFFVAGRAADLGSGFLGAGGAIAACNSKSGVIVCDALKQIFAHL